MKTTKTLFCILPLIFAISSVFASDFSYLKTRTKSWKLLGERSFWEGEITPETLTALDSIYESSPQSYTFYTSNGNTFVSIGCTFDLYKLEGKKLINQYQYFNVGYTCATKPLERDNKHYLLSGYAFWSNHLDLMVLEPTQGSWEYVKTRNQPEYYGTDNIYQNSQGIVALFGGYYNPRKDINNQEEFGYFLDWKTQTWKKIEIKIDGTDILKARSLNPINFLETKDFGFLNSNADQKNLGWNIIDKEKGEIYFFENRNSDIFLSPYLEIIGNNIYFQSPNGNSKTVNLEEILAKSVKVGQIKILEEPAFEVPPAKELVYILSIFVLGVLVLIRPIWRKKIIDPIQVPVEKPIQEFIDVILPYSGKLLNTESLDKILGIDILENFDSKRLKRSRIISEINKQYIVLQQKELITRSKNPEDRRYVYYKIES